MRKCECFNENWRFSKGCADATACPAQARPVILPHTWNAQDGQDGGNDYYRGEAWYYKTLNFTQSLDAAERWLEFRGAAMSAEVYLNGQKLGSHAGGYSTFRVMLSALHNGENLLAVRVNNEKNRTVYPQKADFTFYGGLYRDVYLLTVPPAHFALDRHGSSALQVTAVLNEDLSRAEIEAEAWITGSAQSVTFTLGAQKKTVTVDGAGYAATRFTLDHPHLWNGVDDPYLYTMQAELPESGDGVETTFGCRSFTIDPEKGFILNGRSYRLCGGARHQDRQDLGNALTRREHEEDLALLLEMGCTSVRLAHYQHDAYFYDLCDQYGLIAWAEIPYITEHMPDARENTMQQMTELILQNYNHPSIVCWGLSNEITAAGGVNDDMVENHRILNNLSHKLDPTRLTTMAHAFMLDTDDPFVRLPDVCGYNLYFGWYLGELQQNETFLDEFHRKYPQMPVALSEFGADANPAYQNSNPQRGDWSESYQTVYHEHMMQMWLGRPYIWALYIWNMFDFAADGRSEGGKPGQNQKGLVTFDRRTKKDAFYLYKAYLSKEPFVHLCGRRYVDRTESQTEIKVYSNQPEVTLLVDGSAVETQTGDKIYRFTVPISSEHRIEAVSGGLRDEITIRKVDTPNCDYYYGGSNVVNWFDREDEIVREGYFSIKDSMETVDACPAAHAVIEEMLLPVLSRMGDAYGEVAKSVTMPESMQKLIAQMSVEGWLRQAAKLVTPDLVHKINHALNQVKKEVTI